jgi:GST-like protein
MIDVYYWPTPNGFKVTLFLEEAGIPYKIVPVDIGAGDQFTPQFLEISPNNRMPAIVDPDGPDGRAIAIFESGAILIYLAEKYRRFMPQDVRGRFAVIQWVMWQMANVGPMLGQTHHFRLYAPEALKKQYSPEEVEIRTRYGADRYTNEAKRLYRVLDNELDGKDYMCGEYSIADMATYPWIRPWKRQGIELEEHPNVARWFELMTNRPAVQKVLEDGKKVAESARQVSDEERRANLFGKRQWEHKMKTSGSATPA